MERMKTISLLCVVLACVAPALAADWYQIPAGGDYGTGNFDGFNYDAAPADTSWLSNNYVPNYTDIGDGTPYYVASGETLGPIINDSAVELRSNAITAGLYIGNDLTAGTMRFGDSYWPLNYSYYGTTYTDQYARQTDGDVTFTLMTLGRDDTEWDALPIAVHNKWNIRHGSLNIGTLTQLNTDTTVTTVDGIGLTVSTISAENSPHGLTAGEATIFDMQTINIGTLNLNDTMTYLHANAGTWNIGDITGDAADLTISLFGWNADQMVEGGLNPATWGDPRVYGSLFGKITLPYDDLMAVINAGNFYASSGRWDSRVDYKDLDGGLTSHTSVPNYNTAYRVVITAENMDDFLQVDINGDMATVHIIPEPATLVLLGLGSVVATFRRKR